MGLIWTTTLGSGGKNSDLSDALSATQTVDDNGDYLMNLGLSFTSDYGYPNTLPIYNMKLSLVLKDELGNQPGELGYSPTFSDPINVHGFQPSGGGSSSQFSINGVRIYSADEIAMFKGMEYGYTIYSSGIPYTVSESGSPDNYYYLKFNALLEWYSDTLFNITTDVIEELISLPKDTIPFTP